MTTTRRSLRPQRLALDVVEHRLQNGVRVIVCPLPHLSRAHVVVSLRGGPVHEGDSTWGLSHLVEHMVFRGTRAHADARGVSLAADAFGGDVGAATYRDRVVYDTRVDTDRVKDAFELLSLMMGAPRFEGLNVEREVIEEELTELYDDDGQEVDADNVTFRRVFHGHALARSIEGTLETLRSFDKASLRSFHAAAYGAQNLVVVVAGSVAPRSVVAAARATFGKLAAGVKPPVGEPPKERAKKGRVDVVRTDMSQTAVRLCFPAPGMHSKDRGAVSVLARLLDDGPASRLQAEVVDRAGLAYSLWAYADLYEERGLVEIGSLVRHDRVGRLVESVCTELAKIAAVKPRADELTRTAERFRRDLRDMLDDPSQLADGIAKSAIFGLPFSPEVACREVEAVTGDDVRRAARELLVGAQATLVLVGQPSKKETARATQAVQRLAS
jgi:predicted Zn-dependent peptidase